MPLGLRLSHYRLAAKSVDAPMGKPKYYAVQRGFAPGVYRSWNDCQNQVNGFRGAVYKRFDNPGDAHKFVSQQSGYAMRTRDDREYDRRPSYQTSASPPNQTMSDDYHGPFYGVANGRQNGVFTDWKDVQEQVMGFPGQKYKKFSSLRAAEAFVKENAVQQQPNFRVDSVRVTEEERPKTYYAVKYRDGSSEIFSSWPQCKRAISGVQGVTFKKFNSLEQASRFVEGEGQVQSDPLLDISIINAYLEFHTEEELSDLQDQRPTKIYCDGSFFNIDCGRQCGIGIFFGDGDPRNVAARVNYFETDSYIAEVYATNKALSIIMSEINDFLDYDFSGILPKYEINTDSETVINILTQYAATWSNEDFLNRRGGAEIKEMYDMYQNIKDFYDEYQVLFNGYRFHLNWIKGHAGEYGNEMADRLAKMGASS